MGELRYREGGVTVTLSGDLLAGVDAAIRRGMAGALEAMQARAEQIAQEARAGWYGPQGVTRRTGQSGDVQVVTTVDADRSEVRVGVGSTDTRRRGSRPLWVFVHRPTATSAYGSGTPNPLASDGAILLDVYIRRPTRAAVPGLASIVGKLITARLG